ncbi:MAG TPA: DegQ family serine endoprotease [Rhodocyclaceae bacterium]|nr:DegQ family serine endoprotease [Rhodocyclaceae bacterium]
MSTRNLFLGSFLFATLIGCSPSNNAQTATPVAAPAPSGGAASSGPAVGVMLPDFAALVEKHSPAVVNISTTQQVRRRGPRGTVPGLPNIPGLPDDEALQEFFKRFIPRGDLPEGHPAPQSLGSGFIISADGVVLTNAHVVDDAEEVTVRLNDKREFKAKILGTDKRTDVAVLKIDAKDLPTAPLGDPDRLRVGEWVLAIGSPFGFDSTVTAGIVSAKGRSLPDETYVPFIQTDVAVNPGNSGGPLFNLKGEVIGINSQIYSRSGGYMGISFAIPIDVAMKVADQLRTSGKVSRGRLGVMIQELNADLAQSFGLDKPTGALVSGVEKDSPAEKAGIKSGDIILGFNGKPVNSSRELPGMVGQTKPGTTSKLEVWRDGKKIEIAITVGKLDGNEKLGRSQPDGDDKDGTPDPTAVGRFGLGLVPLPAEARKQLGIDAGVLVQKAEGEAARAGIKAGDVIEKVGNQSATSPDQVAGLLKGLKKGKSVALLIRREDGSRYFTLQAKD